MKIIHPYARQILVKGERKLYKFRSFDPLHPEYISRIFTHCELYFPSPKQLNDPFEFKLRISPPVLLSEADKYKAEQEAHAFLLRNGTPHHEAIPRAKFARDPVFMEEMAAKLTETLPQEWDPYRICSFSSIWDSLLLWSHYSDSHRGICLVFDANYDDFGLAYQVQYSKDYPSISYFDRDTDKLIELMALTKASAWSYECEFRLLSKEPWYEPLLPVHDHVYTFPKERLIGVILGSEIIPENESYIRGLMSGFGGKLELLRARRSRNTYSLELTSV